MTATSVVFSNAITSAPAPSAATRAIVRASSYGESRLNRMLNRPATWARLSVRSPPVTWTRRVPVGIAWRRA